MEAKQIKENNNTTPKLKRKVAKDRSGNNNPPEDAPSDPESQFILRLPTEYASTVRSIAQSNGAKDRLTIKFHPDGHHGVITVDGVPLACKLMNLPCVLESLKTVDNNTFYKTADINQILVCTPEGDLDPPAAESSNVRAKDGGVDKRFRWNHGITRPLKNTRKRRFRKMAKKKYADAPDVENEVKRLLSADAEAVASKWELEATEEPQKTEQKFSAKLLDDIFGDLSSSDEEDEGQKT